MKNRLNPKLWIHLPCLIGLTLLVSIMPAIANELPMGWKTATLDISAQTLEQAMGANRHEVNNLIVTPEESRKESLDDTFHLSRYFDDRFESLDGLDGLRNDAIDCHIEANLECRFKQIRKISFPGKAFHLEGMRQVVFWQDLAHPEKSVMIVEYVLESKKLYEDLLEEYTRAHGDPIVNTLGRYWLIADTKSWQDGGTYLKLCDTYPIKNRDVPDRYSIVFGNLMRIRAAQAEMNRLLRSKSTGATQPSSTTALLEVQSFSLDEERSSFTMVKRYGLRFADWRWPIIKQHIDPEVYYRRFEDESNKPYFKKVFSYFSGRRSLIKFAKCRRLVSSEESLWRAPFNSDRKDCFNVFPSAEELEELYSNDRTTYNSIQRWYAEGFGVPFPIFNILVYNPSATEVVISHLIYKLKYIDQLLPEIVDQPPQRPYVHHLDVCINKPQTLPLKPGTTLRVPAGQHRNFSIMLKSTKGIGHVCRVEIGIVVKRGKTEEQVISDERLVFATVLSSRVKRLEESR